MKPQIKKIGLYRLTIQRHTNQIQVEIKLGGILVAGTSFNQLVDDSEIETWAEKTIVRYENKGSLEEFLYGNMI